MLLKGERVGVEYIEISVLSLLFFNKSKTILKLKFYTKKKPLESCVYE